MIWDVYIQHRLLHDRLYIRPVCKATSTVFALTYTSERADYVFHRESLPDVFHDEDIALSPLCCSGCWWRGFARSRLVTAMVSDHESCSDHGLRL